MELQYTHTQKAPLAYLLAAVAAVMLVSAYSVRNEWLATVAVTAVAGITLVLALAFHSLTVSDEGDRLAIRFGPLPLFEKRITYAEVTAVQPGRSSLIDGWGIHWIPGRGWIYNLWGFDCAVVQLGTRTVRIGTDDVDNLVSFLRARTGMADSGVAHA